MRFKDVIGPAVVMTLVVSGCKRPAPNVEARSTKEGIQNIYELLEVPQGFIRADIGAVGRWRIDNLTVAQIPNPVDVSVEYDWVGDYCYGELEYNDEKIYCIGQVINMRGLGKARNGLDILSCSPSRELELLNCKIPEIRAIIVVPTPGGRDKEPTREIIY